MKGAKILTILSFLHLGTVLGIPAARPQDLTDEFFDGLPEPQLTGAPFGTETSGPAVDRSAIIDAVVAQATAIDAPGADPALTNSPKPEPTEPGKFRKRSEVITPSGYYLVFSGLNGATQAPSYLTFRSISAYDPGLCAVKCNSISSWYVNKRLLVIPYNLLYLGSSNSEDEKAAFSTYISKSTQTGQLSSVLFTVSEVPHLVQQMLANGGMVFTSLSITQTAMQNISLTLLLMVLQSRFLEVLSMVNV
ncbi:hypothetical protein TWF718_004758 [Orbilia javanica]|uniref:Uncharacterized protein n=1 Tax=Orbilia javanica TaxID=47235 RepID=A0AAN8N6R9_9PEZI